MTTTEIILDALERRLLFVYFLVGRSFSHKVTKISQFLVDGITFVNVSGMGTIFLQMLLLAVLLGAFIPISLLSLLILIFRKYCVYVF